MESLLQKWPAVAPLGLALGVAMLLERFTAKEQWYELLWRESPHTSATRPTSPFHKIAGRITSFETVFDRVFGRRHLTLKCFVRSGLATFLVVATLYCIGAGLDSGSLTGAVDTINSSPTFYMVAISTVALTSWIPDYLSLLQTRWALGWIGRDEGGLAAIIVLVIELALTVVISVVGTLTFTMVGIPLLFATLNSHDPNSGVGDGIEVLLRRGFGIEWEWRLRTLPLLVRQFTVNSGVIATRLVDADTSSTANFVCTATPPVAPGFWSGFLTSLWLYAYLLAIAISAGLRRYAKWTGPFEDRFLRKEEHPLVSLWLLLLPPYALVVVLLALAS